MYHNKNKLKSMAQNNLNESHKYNVKWNKPHILCFLQYEVQSQTKIIYDVTSQDGGNTSWIEVIVEDIEGLLGFW